MVAFLITTKKTLLMVSRNNMAKSFTILEKNQKRIKKLRKKKLVHQKEAIIILKNLDSFLREVVQGCFSLISM
jgi:ribosomal protein S20